MSALVVSRERFAALRGFREAELYGFFEAHQRSWSFGGTGDIGKPALSFVTATGDAFLVANNPAGAAVGCTVQALAYPVRLSPAIARTPQHYLWVICPWSYAELWGLRDRADSGLPPNVFVDAESDQVRYRPASAEPGAAPDRGGRSS